MTTQTRTGSMQMRVNIAICVFIILASVPLHLVDLDPDSFQLFKFPDQANGGSETAMFYQLNLNQRTLTLRYQNRVPFPENANQLFAQIRINSNDREYTIYKDNVTLEWPKNKNKILEAQIALPIRLQEHLYKEINMEQNKDSKDSKTNKKPYLKHTHEYHFILNFYRNDKTIAQLTGTLNPRNRYVSYLAITPRSEIDKQKTSAPER